MTRLLIARITLTIIGVIAWGYGASVNRNDIRWVGIAILAVSLILRFLPKHWFETQSERSAREAAERARDEQRRSEP